MAKKYVTIEIDENILPLLFKLKDDHLGDTIQDILHRGYKEYFNIRTPMDINKDIYNSILSKNREDVIKNMDMNTNILKLEMQNGVRNIESINKLDTKLDRFTNMVENIFGISQNSNKKGDVSEDILYQTITSRFPDLTYTRTRNIAHNADGELVYPSGQKVMVEVKNYTTVVNEKELEKFRFDLKHMGVQYGLFCSLQNNITGKKRLDYEQFEHNNKIYHIIYIPAVLNETSKIESGILLMERLYELHNTNINKYNVEWLQNNIVGYFVEIEKIVDRTSQLRDQYLEMEDVIKNQLETYYGNFREYEYDLKNKIKTIWDQMMNDFNKANKESVNVNDMDKIIGQCKRDRLKLYILKIFDILKVNNCRVMVNPDDDMTWAIFHKTNNIGKLCKKKSKLDLKLSMPFVTLYITKDKNTNDNTIAFFKVLLETKLGKIQNHA